MASRSTYVSCAGFELHVTEWGAAGLPTVLMAHGLARTGRDFDPIARALSERWHVVCPDMIGRGLSQWSADPDRDYRFERYIEIMAAMADAMGFGRFAWVGTSMGGAMGLRAAAGTLRGRIGALVVNDIGPSLPDAAVARILAYGLKPPVFATMGEYEGFVRTAYQPFGAHTEAQWRHLAETTARRLSDGRITTHYDPEVIHQLDRARADYEFWDLYDSLTGPLLLLRGADSDLLPAETAQAMALRGPRAQIAEIAGCGHAPGLNTPAQIDLVASFLTQHHREKSP